MSLNAKDLSKKLQSAVSGGMPTCATLLSTAIKTYCESNGTPVKGIKVILAPCTGAGWLTLAANAGGEGVGDAIIQTAIATELSASMTTIVTPTGPTIIPSIFNSGAKVKNLKECSDFTQCWDRISEAIIDYLSTELK